MTENKRFILIDGVKRGTHSGIWDKQKQNNRRTGDELWIGEVAEWLNKLYKENDILKQELKTKRVVNRQYEELQKLKKENEQLKGEVAHYKLILMSLEEEAKRLSQIR